MTFYVGLVDRAEAGFGVWFPDAPGATSMGSTMDELFSNGMDALRIWAEDAIADGDGMPAPREIAQLLDDPDVQVSLREDNAAFIQIPLVMDQGRLAKANISIDTGLLDAIDAAAKQRGVTRSAFLAGAARDKIARRA